ncbi:Allantoate permease [Wickerhamomyces ciferrii]|uniref:Allantoate permease n=1 Tax=Wickerhamomyces ciferrii (strain ATCC 14091 / BCRC 22168 / CBS 111 / JCM 3599 / NBRC 0793 / NRRL Y-1031 F-60-10) TaxID=1206466 RepID=K0L0X6_WICCF|nr:Allantoate permease [Wickerhamomyces ciferrii]CCH47103.1 Allantoate permease [Wickerhamomyces ciferrii]
MNEKLDSTNINQHDENKGEVLSTYISPILSNGKINREDADEAMKLALDLEGQNIELDEDTSKKLLRKIDFCLLPLIGFLYACQFMDKTTTSYAAVMGLKTDLNMIGDQYSWTGTAFYIGYLAFEFPANALLQRFPLAKTTSTFIFIWGVILCLHAVPKYPGFVTLRTLLGIFESSISPAMVILTSQWYKKEEQFIRTACWFASNGLGIIMGGAIAYGCAQHAETYSFEAWKVLFIVTGLMTIALSIAFFLHIPDTPSKAWWLTPTEKILVVERIRDNQQGFGNKHFKKYQFKETLIDPLTWLYFIFAIVSNIPNGSLTNFGSILLSEDFKYNKKESLLMNMPCGVVEFIGCIGFCLLNYKFPRMLISFAAMVVALFSSCLLAFVENNNNARLAGYYLQYVYPTTTICALSCFASNTAGHTKKISTTAIFFIGYCIGNLIGPQTFTEAPYTGGKIAIVVCNTATLIIILAIYFVYIYSNKKKESKLNQLTQDQLDALENSEFADLTDRENPKFRYSV